MIKKILAAFFAAVLVIGSFSCGISALANSGVTSKTIYTSASDWAKPEIYSAFSARLIPKALLSVGAAAPATRRELCELAVRLYEETTGTTAEPVSPNPFTDTSDAAILKAFALGITTGTSATTFSPDELTNREQVATMFSRVIRVMLPAGDFSAGGAPAYADQGDISPWALEHVLYMSKAGVLKGAGGNFMPRAVTAEQQLAGYGTTTREQAIAISVRIFAANGGDVPSGGAEDGEDAAAGIPR